MLGPGLGWTWAWVCKMAQLELISTDEPSPDPFHFAGGPAQLTTLGMNICVFLNFWKPISLTNLGQFSVNFLRCYVNTKRI